MKKNLFAASLMLVTFCSLASEHVNGHFPPAPQMPVDSRCQISTSNSNVDYGLQSRWQMQDVDGSSQAATPGKRQLSVTVVCPFTHDMRIKVMGERNIRGGFRYGTAGELRVRIISAQLDGESVSIALTTSGGAMLGAPQETLALLPNQTFSAVRGNQPAQGKAFNVRLEIEPVLRDQDARVGSRQANESSLSFEFAD